MNNLITIGLVSWNGEKYIRYCLDSVLGQTFQDFNLIILDNGSQDGTVKIIEQEYLSKFGDKIKFIKSSENLGFAKGHNKLNELSDSKYHMLLNQDIILDKEYLNRSLEVFQQYTNVGVVSGKIYKWEFGEDEWKSKIIDSVGLELFKNGRIIEKDVGTLDEGQFSKDIEVFGVSGTIPIFLKSALEEVKYKDEYLDESFFSYKEDVDLAYRLRWMGYNAFIAVKAIAYHDRTAKSVQTFTLKSLHHDRKKKSELVNYNSYKNHIVVLYKNLSLSLFLRFGFRIKLFEIKKFLYLLLTERETLKGLKDIWQMRKEIFNKRKQIMKNRKIKSSQMASWFN